MRDEKKGAISLQINPIDGFLRMAIALGLLGWNSIEGAIFENEYPTAFVKLYPYPIWRALLILAVFLGAAWTPDVGVMMAFMVFFYGMDMEVTLQKWAEE